MPEHVGIVCTASLSNSILAYYIVSRGDSLLTMLITKATSEKLLPNIGAIFCQSALRHKLLQSMHCFFPLVEII